MGFLWAAEETLLAMPPFLGGGEMIQEVFLDHSTWAELPHKFEAGTPAIGEAIGMGAAITYLQTLGLDAIIGFEEAVSMMVSGFCRDVFNQLPMEFAAEADKLLALKLEGSVG